MMRIVFTGGGTAGHVLPNLAIIEELRRCDRKNLSPTIPAIAPIPAFFYIGELGGVEERMTREAGIDFRGIHAGKLRRYWDWRNVADIFKLPLGFFEAFFILRKLRPSLVFSKGGYVSVPVVLAARVLKIPVWIHESDASPGLATRITARFAERIFTAFEEAALSLRGGRFSGRRSNLASTPMVVGNPIRRGVLQGSAAEGFRLTGFTKDKPVILVMGGSLGARSLNEILYAILPKITKHAQVVHITGKKQVWDEDVIARSVATKQSSHSNYKSFEFLNVEQLAHMYRITDLAVSRAGSGSIFELLALKIPMLLVPLPKCASRGDQIENARIFSQRGWASVADQDVISPDEFLARILMMLEKAPFRQKMIEAQQQAHFEDAAEKIAEEILRRRS